MQYDLTSPLGGGRLRRRWFLAGGAAALTAPFGARVAQAYATGTHSHMQGDIELIVVSDGHLTVPTSMLAPSAPQQEVAAFLTEVFGAVPETLMPATNPTLLRTGDDLVLVDTGSGDKFQPTAGKLMANLALNGIDPGEVTKVVFSHAHPDHIWGTLAPDGGLAFPNAAYYVGQTEWEFWTNPDVFSMLPPEFHPFAEGAQRDLGAVKDRVKLLRDGDAVAAGISAIDTPGHTPGHLALMVEGGDGLILSADLAASEVVSVQYPDWAFGFDADPDLASATRKAMLDRAATDGHRILGFHFTYPGVGVVERDSGSYRFVPVG